MALLSEAVRNQFGGPMNDWRMGNCVWEILLNFTLWAIHWLIHCYILEFDTTRSCSQRRAEKAKSGQKTRRGNVIERTHYYGADHFSKQLKHLLNNENYTNHLSYADSRLMTFFSHRPLRFLCRFPFFFFGFFISRIIASNEVKETRRKFRQKEKEKRKSNDLNQRT